MNDPSHATLLAIPGGRQDKNNSLQAPLLQTQPRPERIGRVCKDGHSRQPPAQSSASMGTLPSTQAVSTPGARWKPHLREHQGGGCIYPWRGRGSGLSETIPLLGSEALHPRRHPVGSSHSTLLHSPRSLSDLFYTSPVEWVLAQPRFTEEEPQPEARIMTERSFAHTPLHIHLPPAPPEDRPHTSEDVLVRLTAAALVPTRRRHPARTRKPSAG
ncbi:uncharacterized protein LOC123831796 [Phyllostomus hastatus]|uniref:uncharacterized protein LOC123831796 n=1 Tax=Phyllostomus hastatus TaxID=9423 RepID=UPI001E68361B|nr:uncharacterized protein LOC123831796 [Phyllostomus hastatus]